ncbi:MAG: 2-C-methyl-D-erythritol 2,4-cyclodiphosphate synthase [Bacteroidetes bacterium]|nr:MAG: 2-C-methyl-D-erythritol 2,4-cyclodiphosphate synthase [Bacteroidota bacterium]
MRIGQGYDVHRLEEGLPLWICGVRVPSTFGAVAHSDGDAAIHALCDALLGALALGDIGKHFPDTDPRFKGIDSKLLLAQVVELVRREGYSICNVDITVMLQAPKLRPHIDGMRAVLAETMGLDLSQVSVKATTTERLGFVGTGEGIAAQAVVLLA